MYKPTVIVVVPAILQLLNRRIKKSICEQLPDKYRTIFENSDIAGAMEKMPLIIRSIIKNKVRKNLGGSLHTFIVGAAEVPAPLIYDFACVGIRTLQGYGLTECAPLLAGNSDFFFNAESTGRAIPGVELRIEDPNEAGIGEITARGKNIMLGYFNDEESTRKVLRGGWFHTGDLGRIDRDGFLYITGRLKNVIVTSNGKNIYPEELETRLCTHDEITECIVIAGADSNGDVCVKAKILPNIDLIKERLGHLPGKDELKQIIKDIIAEINLNIPNYKNIKSIEILSQELQKTTTRKVLRFGTNMA